jgi:hypothetical protein
MPIICKIQLDTADFKAELDRIAKLTERVQSEVSARSETAAQKVGSDAGKAAQSVGKAVEEIGSAAEEAARNVESAAQNAGALAGNIADTAEAVAANAAEAGEAVRASAEVSAGTIREGIDAIAQQTTQAQTDISSGAEKTAESIGTATKKAAESVKDAAKKSAESVESVKKAAVEAAESVSKQGDASEKAGTKTGNSMKAAAGSIKSAAGATSGVISALGGVSPQLGFIGQALQALLSGPIAAVMAAVTALIAVATAAWDVCTTSAEEYRKKLAAILDLQGKVTDRLRDGMDASDRYLTRLEELDRMENKGNAAKAEQARLLEILTRRYGDLGIAIDKDTGKMSGLDEVRKKIRGDGASKIADSLQKELGIKLKQIPEVEVGMGSGSAKDRARLEAVLAGYDPDKVKRSYETMSGTMGPSITRETMSGPKISMREERAFLADYIEKADITDEKTTEALKARIDALDDYLKTADEITRIRTTGHATESDEAATMNAETSRENQRESSARSDKQFTQNRELAAMSGEDRAEALRKLIREEEDKIDRLGKMPGTDGEILNSRQRRYDLKKQLDALDDEKQRRRDEEDDAYAAGLTPVEKAELLRNRLAKAQKDEEGYRKELSDLEKPGIPDAADDDRKLDLKDKILKTQGRILTIGRQIAEAEAEAVRLEEEAAEKVSRYLDGKAGDLELARLEAAAEYEKADALRLENELRQQGVSLSEQELDAAKKLTAERNSVALQSNLTDQARDLLDAAKRSVGLDREADEDKAIREAEKLKRGKLDDSERDYVLKLTELSRAVSGREDNPLAWKPDLSVKTNELTARGGFATGAVMPSADQINRSMLSEIKNGMKYLSNIEDLVREGLQT